MLAVGPVSQILVARNRSELSTTEIEDALMAKAANIARLLVGPSGIRLIGDSLYGRLLIAKVLVFLAMVALESINRFRLTPALEKAIGRDDCPAALGALRRSLAAETTCAIAVLAIVAWLGTLEPIVSVVGGP
jgi:putative copper resistance protein D